MTRADAIKLAIEAWEDQEDWSHHVQVAVEAGIILGLRMAAKLKPSGTPVHSFNGGFYDHAEQCADLATKREKRLWEGSK